ncbi:hypothetical protein F511_43852 [Dorcoceras hygrometricum]|uniref:Uncharacterized protein n=1 Tax=Dorcoceras hygrometricum TaxID=472368 RepID=A0A2Z7C8U5_9LAMI|nr:hypothetical protein F511_43852 [Dorcoceras hygrometricum]
MHWNNIYALKWRRKNQPLLAFTAKHKSSRSQQEFSTSTTTSTLKFLEKKREIYVALSARMNEEVTRVSQHFGVLITRFSSCANGERSADGLRNQSQELLVDMMT